MTTQYTPGPWCIDESSPWLIFEPGFGNVCNVRAAGLEPQADANARLIAEAPAMLEALRDAERTFGPRHKIGRTIRALLARIDGVAA